MYSPEFMKYLITKDIENHIVAEKNTPEEIEFNDNKIFNLSRFATVPIETKN